MIAFSTIYFLQGFSVFNLRIQFELVCSQGIQLTVTLHHVIKNIGK